jgi:hypothetical protein
MNFKFIQRKLHAQELNFPITKALQLFQTLSVFSLIEHYFSVEDLATYFVIVALGSIMSILDFGAMSTVVRFRHQLIDQRNLRIYVVKTLSSYFRNVIFTAFIFLGISNYTNIDNRILGSNSNNLLILVILLVYMISQGPQLLAEKLDVSIHNGALSAKWALITTIFIPLTSSLALFYVSDINVFLLFLYLGIGLLGWLHLFESIVKFNSSIQTSVNINATTMSSEGEGNFLSPNSENERKQKGLFAMLQIFAYISSQLSIAMIAYFLTYTEVIQFGIISRIITPLAVILNSTNLHLWTNLSDGIEPSKNRYFVPENLRMEIIRAFRKSFLISAILSLFIPVLLFVIYRFFSLESNFPSLFLITSSMVWLITICVASVMDYSLKGLGWIKFTFLLGLLLFVVSNLLSIILLKNGLEYGPLVAQSFANIAGLIFFAFRLGFVAK